MGDPDEPNDCDSDEDEADDREIDSTADDDATSLGETVVTRQKDTTKDEKRENVDIETVKSLMQKMTLPAASMPKWGAMLSDQDFITAVRETIQDKEKPM